jgi:hypothetical protein
VATKTLPARTPGDDDRITAAFIAVALGPPLSHGRSSVTGTSQAQKKMPSAPRQDEVLPGTPEEGADQHQHAQNIMKIVKTLMANLRSSGLLLGFLVHVGRPGSERRAHAGDGHAGDIGWNIVSSSCRPRKYHGAFDGLGVLVGVGQLQQRGVDEDREHE